ncbi:MAG: FAD-dependent oxidoreductase [Corynebacterium sp.]|nr:FAD-dependent oxidoreductase [Corynebacterium sp.]
MARVIIVGAGMVGLATAWHVQERGYEVDIYDRTGVAAGASRGNAGWLAPAKTIPLAEKGLWGLAPSLLFNPDAALSMPFKVDFKLWGFLAQFMAHATDSSWDATMELLTPIDKLALDAFSELELGGVEAKSHDAPYVIGFNNEASSRGFFAEIAGAIRYGQSVEISRVENPQDLMPILSRDISAVYRLEGQRFIEPGPYVHALADAIRSRGATIHSKASVTEVTGGKAPSITLSTGEVMQADKVVIANGAWLPQLAKAHGVRVPVQAGRGYSFSVATPQEITCPLYLPQQRIACTPYQGRFRIAGTMEFRDPDDPLVPRRIQSIVKNAREALSGVDLDDRRDEWVGSRPVTPDGLPLIGATKSENVFVGGGHGMWGIVLGPVTGKLLAQYIDTGTAPAAIKAFDPLRAPFATVRKQLFKRKR